MSTANGQLVVFDLDGTISCDEHRLGYIKQEPQDWKRYFELCPQDKPIWPLIHATRAFWSAGWQVEIWTGRDGGQRYATIWWLHEHDVKYHDLKMRPPGDTRPNTELKGEWLDECEHPPELIFEDLPVMVDYWRSRGILCCQVADREVA